MDGELQAIVEALGKAEEQLREGVLPRALARARRGKVDMTDQVPLVDAVVALCESLGKVADAFPEMHTPTVRGALGEVAPQLSILADKLRRASIRTSQNLA